MSSTIIQQGAVFDWLQIYFKGSANIGVPVKLENFTTISFDLNRDDDMDGTVVVHWHAIGVKP